MKFILICGIIFLPCPITIFAKSATVHITIKNYKGLINIYDPELKYDLTKPKFAYFHLDRNHSASYTMVLDKPTYLILYLSDKSFNYSLFLTPGDELFLTADLGKKNNNIVVTGKGSNNNQPEIFSLTNINIQPFNDDATPNRVIYAINKQFLLNKSILANYIKVHKPTPEFIKNATINLQYFAPVNYYESNHSNAFGKPKDELQKWQKSRDSLFSTIKFRIEDDGLTAYNQTRLIDDFMMSESGELWMEYQLRPALFFKQWFRSDTARGKKLFNFAQQGILIEKVIDKHFTGKIAEYAYGESIRYLFNKADYPSTILLYSYFKKKYPSSEYIKKFKGPIAKIVIKLQQALNSQIVFFPDNGTKFNTFNDVLKITKGKTVLVDMWGTWCGPCREEIEKNAKQLKSYFKGKNVTFLYIANLDVGKEKEWKKQIAYFQIEGMHILANPKLTDDIMRKVKSTGYPTYILIKKDGSYKQTKTKYPVNFKAMIKEIESASI